MPEIVQNDNYEENWAAHDRKCNFTNCSDLSSNFSSELSSNFSNFFISSNDSDSAGDIRRKVYPVMMPVSGVNNSKYYSPFIHPSFIHYSPLTSLSVSPLIGK